MSRQFTYFHYVHRDGENSYFKIDHENQRVIKCCLKSNLQRGANNKPGLYEIQYLSFVTQYFGWTNKELQEKTKVWHNSPVAWKQLKYTTARQWLKAVLEVTERYAGREVKMLKSEKSS